MMFSARVKSHRLRHFIPCSVIQRSARFLLEYAAPLFEEKGCAAVHAIIANLPHPVRFHPPRARPGFPADDHPIDARQVQSRQGTQQRFEREKLRPGAGCPERRQTTEPFFGFDARAEPDVGRPVQSPVEESGAARPLGEHLKSVLSRAIHHVENGLDENSRAPICETDRTWS